MATFCTFCGAAVSHHKPLCAADELTALTAQVAALRAALDRLLAIATANATWSWSPIRQEAEQQARAALALTDAQAPDPAAQGGRKRERG